MQCDARNLIQSDRADYDPAAGLQYILHGVLRPGVYAPEGPCDWIYAKERSSYDREDAGDLAAVGEGRCALLEISWVTE